MGLRPTRTGSRRSLDGAHDLKAQCTRSQRQALGGGRSCCAFGGAHELAAQSLAPAAARSWRQASAVESSMAFVWVGLWPGARGRRGTLTSAGSRRAAARWYPGICCSRVATGICCSGPVAQACSGTLAHRAPAEWQQRSTSYGSVAAAHAPVRRRAWPAFSWARELQHRRA